MGKGKKPVILGGFLALALIFSAVDVFALPISAAWAAIAGPRADRIEVDWSTEFVRSPEALSSWTLFHLDDVPRLFSQTAESPFDEVRDGLGDQDHHPGTRTLPLHLDEGSAGHLSVDAHMWESVEGASAPVPRPSVMLLLGTGLIGLAGYWRKSKK